MPMHKRRAVDMEVPTQGDSVITHQSSVAARHRQWVRALRDEYNHRISRASEEVDFEEESWTSKGGLLQNESDEEEGPCYRSCPCDATLLADDLKAALDFEDSARPTYRAVSFASPQGEPSGGRRRSAVETVEAEWLFAKPPMLRRQSAPQVPRVAIWSPGSPVTS
mmetsp:Transcript_22963/g.50241  ORF Transcript_22963/g.50241 Transcript_22963/m.50241 type:complete len:166 (-) Transcript_22963:691-1188(-)